MLQCRGAGSGGEGTLQQVRCVLCAARCRILWQTWQLLKTDRNYGGRSVAARKAERRSLFLNAALSVFADQGYAGSSVADICASASLARRQFYDEFGSREDLLLALYDQIQLDARIAMVDALDAEPSGQSP